eukprot:2063124-Alexandrium_andersonii.AAC.1
MVKSRSVKSRSQVRHLRIGCAWDAARVLRDREGLQVRLRTWRGGDRKCAAGSQWQSVGT